WRSGLLACLGAAAAVSGLVVRGWLPQGAGWTPWAACVAVLMVYGAALFALRRRLPAFLSFTDGVWR
ncbi:MAG TPA: hypothetical protein VJ997_00035, partial [Longimicrobiales bacterium]|nr:hypothetical protein [Longimicrobiales bacterium]